MSIISGTKPKITDVSVDRQGRMTLTVKLLDRLYQTLRCENIEIDTTSTVDYAYQGEHVARPFKIRGSERTTGVIRFTSKKVTISKKRPAKKR